MVVMVTFQTTNKMLSTDTMPSLYFTVDCYLDLQKSQYANCLYPSTYSKIINCTNLHARLNIWKVLIAIKSNLAAVGFLVLHLYNSTIRTRQFVNETRFTWTICKHSILQRKFASSEQ